MKVIMDSNALITVCKFSVEGNLLIKLILKLCHIIIPSAVKEEAIIAKDIYKDAKVVSDFIKSGDLNVAQANIPEMTFLNDYNLGKGEREAIRLCLEKKDKINYLITDDRLASHSFAILKEVSDDISKFKEA
jgi:predicted nucleic acid-binding protein